MIRSLSIFPELLKCKVFVLHENVNRNQRERVERPTNKFSKKINLFDLSNNKK